MRQARVGFYVLARSTLAILHRDRLQRPEKDGGLPLRQSNELGGVARGARPVAGALQHPKTPGPRRQAGRQEEPVRGPRPGESAAPPPGGPRARVLLDQVRQKARRLGVRAHQALAGLRRRGARSLRGGLMARQRRPRRRARRPDALALRRLALVRRGEAGGRDQPPPVRNQVPTDAPAQAVRVGTSARRGRLAESAQARSLRRPHPAASSTPCSKCCSLTWKPCRAGAGIRRRSRARNAAVVVPGPLSRKRRFMACLAERWRPRGEGWGLPRRTSSWGPPAPSWPS